MNKYRYLLKTGEYAGKIFDGVGCNARSHPDGEPDYEKYGDGIYIPELKLRIKEQRLPYGVAKHGADFVDYEDLVIAFDKYGNEIFKGDSLWAVINKEVCKVTVLSLGDIYHQGCGWYSRILSVKDIDTEKKVKLKNPAACVKITN